MSMLTISARNGQEFRMRREVHLRIQEKEISGKLMIYGEGKFAFVENVVRSENLFETVHWIKNSSLLVNAEVMDLLNNPEENISLISIGPLNMYSKSLQVDASKRDARYDMKLEAETLIGENGDSILYAGGYCMYNANNYIPVTDYHRVGGLEPVVITGYHRGDNSNDHSGAYFEVREADRPKLRSWYSNRLVAGYENNVGLRALSNNFHRCLTLFKNGDSNMKKPSFSSGVVGNPSYWREQLNENRDMVWKPGNHHGAFLYADPQQGRIYLHKSTVEKITLNDVILGQSKLFNTGSRSAFNYVTAGGVQVPKHRLKIYEGKISDGMTYTTRGNYHFDRFAPCTKFIRAGLLINYHQTKYNVMVIKNLRFGVSEGT